MPELSFSILFAGCLFGLIGICGFKIGRINGEPRRMGVGAALCIFPYFISNDWLLWGIGAALTAALIWWKE